VARDPRLRRRALTDAAAVLEDVLASIDASELYAGPDPKSAAWGIAWVEGGRCLDLAAWTSAAAVFFNVALTSFSRHLMDDQAAMPCFLLAVQTLNDSISRRTRSVAEACVGALTEQVRQAHVDERRRIARDLHDRMGEPLSVGLRRLDLQEIAGLSNSDPFGPAGMAREIVVEAMSRLRLVTSDLREAPIASLEKALLRYLDSIGADADADVRLWVGGDEAWATPTVLDEVFLILREATRNALAHGAPALVLIGVDLSVHEMRAWVEDDGPGFVTTQLVGRACAGTGLVSMRERAAQIGGRLVISSTPGQGTRVELYVPLPGRPAPARPAPARPALGNPAPGNPAPARPAGHPNQLPIEHGS
jgi:signal transduction histidine kinase